MLAGGILCVGCNNAPTADQPTTAQSDNQASNDAESDMKPKADQFVIDVRSKEEWDSGHVDTAIHIPHTEIVEGIKAVTADKDACIFLH